MTKSPKVETLWDGNGWLSLCRELPLLGITWTHKSRKYECGRILREIVKRLSVDGFMCYGCCPNLVSDDN